MRTTAPGISCEDDLIVLCFSLGRRDRKRLIITKSALFLCYCSHVLTLNSSMKFMITIKDK